MKKQSKPKSITVIGKRWFDKANGNTSFSCDIFFDGELVAEVPFEYGYGDYYVQAAAKELKDRKLIKLKAVNDNGMFEPLWRYCDRNKITLNTQVFDGLKRDLKKNRTLPKES